MRVSSSINNANFTTDGVDAAIRNLPVDAARDEALEVEKLFDQSFVPVCSPALVEKHGPFTSPDMLKGVPLIHDDSLGAELGRLVCGGRRAGRRRQSRPSIQ